MKNLQGKPPETILTSITLELRISLTQLYLFLFYNDPKTSLHLIRAFSAASLLANFWDFPTPVAMRIPLMYTRILQASFAVFLLSIPTNLQKQILTWLQPMLDQYFGECMISINNISNGSKRPTRGCKNCITS